jgi:predicted DNA-binding transcriptional regulator AlpA
MQNMLKMKDLADRFKVNRTTIYRWMDKEGFPRPVKLANNTIRWKHEDVEAWEQSKQGGE